MEKGKFICLAVCDIAVAFVAGWCFGGVIIGLASVVFCAGVPLALLAGEVAW